MLKVLKFPIAILLSLVVLMLIGTINLKMFFSSPDTAKSFLNKSGMYPLVAVGVRENLLKADVPAGQKGAFLEVANSVLDEGTVKIFVEDIIDQFYANIKNKTSDPKLVIHLSSLSEKMKGALLDPNKALIDQMPAITDRTVDLKQNPFYVTVANLDRTFLYLLVGIVMFSLILLLGDKWSGKLGWFSFSAIFAGLLSGLLTLLFYFGLSERIIQNIIAKAGFEDQKFVLGVKKLILLIADYEKGFYLVATIILFSLFIIFLIVSRLLKKSPDKSEAIVPSAKPVKSN